jgi:hypothetical protein
MNRKDFDVAAGIVERMDKLEMKIFELQGIMNYKYYTITAYSGSEFDPRIGLDLTSPRSVTLNPDEIATEVFIQDILQYYIDTLNLELNELRKSFEEI